MGIQWGEVLGDAPAVSHSALASAGHCYGKRPMPFLCAPPIRGTELTQLNGLQATLQLVVWANALLCEVLLCAAAALNTNQRNAQFISLCRVVHSFLSLQASAKGSFFQAANYL